MEVTWLKALAFGAAFVLGTSSALAEYPERPIRLIIPFTPGGTTDVVARMMAPKLHEKLGQHMVIDNRGGAGGVVASDLTAKAPADGYTLLVTTINHSVNPAVVKNLPYDSVNDFSMVSLLLDLPNLLVANPSVKFNTFPEFIAYAKKNADLNYASSGAGSSSHLAVVMLIGRADLKMTHVPYKGGAQAVLDLLSGRVHVKMETYSNVQGYIKAGKLKLLAVTGATRMDLLPDVPTVAEMGYPGYESGFWAGIVGPKRITEAIRARLERAFIEVIKSEEVSKWMMKEGMRPLGGTGAELAVLIKREIPQWQKVVKEANITLE